MIEPSERSTTETLELQLRTQWMSMVQQLIGAEDSDDAQSSVACVLEDDPVVVPGGTKDQTNL
jgi:hypothetical protein